MQNVWISDAESFHDFLRFTIVYAPDFPKEDYLEEDEQLDLVKAFNELKIGLRFVEEVYPPDVIGNVRKVIDEAWQEYNNGDDFAGSRKLQDIVIRLLPRL